MDIKIQGLSYDILEKALNQARDGRLHILEKLTDTISKPRVKLKDHTPKIIKLEVPKSTIGGIIGPGGKIIQEMQATTETVISIEEVDEKGVVEILGTNQEKIDLDRSKQLMGQQQFDEKLEQNEDLAKLRAGVSLAKAGVDQAKVMIED